MSRHAKGENPQGRSALAICDWYWSRRRIAKAATQPAGVQS